MLLLARDEYRKILETYRRKTYRDPKHALLRPIWDKLGNDLSQIGAMRISKYLEPSLSERPLAVFPKSFCATIYQIYGTATKTLPVPHTSASNTKTNPAAS